MRNELACFFSVFPIRPLAMLVVEFLSVPVSVNAKDESWPLWQSLGKCDPGIQASQATRCFLIKPNIALFNASTASLVLPLPDTNPIIAIRNRIAVIGKRNFVWDGKIDKVGSATFAVVNGALVGNILSADGRQYRIRFAPKIGYVLEEIDRNFVLKEKSTDHSRKIDTVALPALVPAPISGTCTLDNAKFIDVMVVYTPAASYEAGGKNFILAHIYQAVWETNWSYTDSGVSHQIRPVYIEQVAYTGDAADATDSWNALANNDGSMDEVLTYRDAFGADVVVLVVEKSSLGGWTRYILSESEVVVPSPFASKAFAVVAREWLTGQAGVADGYIFAHELGHIMGAAHDEASGGRCGDPGAYEYSLGYSDKTPATPCTKGWRTIMGQNGGCAGCDTIRFFSNPNKTYCNEPLGIPLGSIALPCNHPSYDPQVPSAPTDNAFTLNTTALTVANFRCAQPWPNNVWMKDTWSDNGAEPDPAQASEPMWKSPYIWVRNSRDQEFEKQHEHENPEFGQTNWAYVKLQNGGPSSSGNLELYYADASTSLTWPNDWTLISSQSITTLENRFSEIVEFKWDNLPGQGHYCLLARWISPTDDPMTNVEGPNIGANVRGNNNIVWRNLNIVDLMLPATFKSQISLQNNPSKDVDTVIEIKPSGEKSTSFLGFGKIVVELDDVLEKAWMEGGMKGRGFTIENGKIQSTSSEGVVLSGMRFEAKFLGHLKLTFKRPDDYKEPRRKFVVDVVQSEIEKERKTVIGGVSYEIRTGLETK